MCFFFVKSFGLDLLEDHIDQGLVSHHWISSFRCSFEVRGTAVTLRPPMPWTQLRDFVEALPPHVHVAASGSGVEEVATGGAQWLRKGH